MTAPGDVFGQTIAALEPLLDQHGFRRTEGMDAMLAPGARYAAFAADQEAVRLVWEEADGYVVLEALEPELAGTWADILLRRIDLRRAADADLLSLTQALREVLTIYFDEIEGAWWRAT